MGLIKDLRSVSMPDGNLAHRDVRSHLVTVNTGKFARNCVLTGKSIGEMDYPNFIQEPGLITRIGGISPEIFGYLESSEGTANNALPGHRDIALNASYWGASTLGCWLAYHHDLRPTMIRGYRFLTENGYTPRVWRVEGSNDAISWTTLHSVTVDWTWEAGKQVVEKDIPAENRDYFAHHRIIVDEFDATSIRIYSLQFWNALCPSAGDLLLDADAENPTQISFADGFNQDGTPKNINVTINSKVGIDLLEEDIENVPDINAMYSCILFASCNAETQEISLNASFLYMNDHLADPMSFVPSIISSTVADPWAIFDGNSSTGVTMNSTSTLHFSFAQPIVTNALFVKLKALYTGDDITVSVSEDNGLSWTEVLFHHGSTLCNRALDLGRVYSITRIKIWTDRGVVYGIDPIDMAQGNNGRKMTGGKIYEYDPENEIWNQVYKVPLGTFSLLRNPDNTGWEIASFIPTHVPQMTVAPWFRKTSGNVAL